MVYRVLSKYTIEYTNIQIIITNTKFNKKFHKSYLKNKVYTLI